METMSRFGAAMDVPTPQDAFRCPNAVTIAAVAAASCKPHTSTASRLRVR